MRQYTAKEEVAVTERHSVTAPDSPAALSVGDEQDAEDLGMDAWMTPPRHRRPVMVVPNDMTGPTPLQARIFYDSTPMRNEIMAAAAATVVHPAPTIQSAVTKAAAAPRQQVSVVTVHISTSIRVDRKLPQPQVQTPPKQSKHGGKENSTNTKTSLFAKLKRRLSGKSALPPSPTAAAAKPAQPRTPLLPLHRVRTLHGRSEIMEHNINLGLACAQHLQFEGVSPATSYSVTRKFFENDQSMMHFAIHPTITPRKLMEQLRQL